MQSIQTGGMRKAVGGMCEAKYICPTARMRGIELLILPHPKAHWARVPASESPQMAPGPNQSSSSCHSSSPSPSSYHSSSSPGPGRAAVTTAQLTFTGPLPLPLPLLLLPLLFFQGGD